MDKLSSKDIENSSQNIDFEEYTIASEPHKRERAYAWRTAIGLQAVDGLQVSDYLKQTAQRNIEGEITIDEARKLIDTYYQSKTNREPDDDEKQEADKVSGNITKLILERSFSFSVSGLISLHRHVFEGVFKHAGKLRTYDITKNEWVLRGDTVLYGRWQDLRMAMEYDLEQEKQFDYSGLSMDQVVEHIAKFVSGIWQIHPFCEGNTRTTAIFTIKYLRSIGFEVTNNLFNQYSWYFRNALVRANYRNVAKNIDYEPKYLIRFFRNLLMDENNDLKNRYLLINPPQEWAQEPPTTTPTTTPTSTPTTSAPKWLTNNENIVRLVKAIGSSKMSVKEMLEAVGLKNRENFLEFSLNPAIKDKYLKMLYPDKPNHPRQKYLLTVKGQMLYSYLN